MPAKKPPTKAARKTRGTKTPAAANAKKPATKKAAAKKPAAKKPAAARATARSAENMPCDCEAHAELALDAPMPRGFKPTGTVKAGGVATRAGSNWRVAASLLKLRDQVNARAPSRKKSHDGTIGDTSHSKRSSDHNPWVDWNGRVGVVTALDITHDPARGCDAGAIVEAIRRARDSRVKYLIWNRRIANHASVHGAAAWAWRAYNGANPHSAHCHISVKAEKPKYDDASAWTI